MVKTDSFFLVLLPIIHSKYTIAPCQALDGSNDLIHDYNLTIPYGYATSYKRIEPLI